MQVEHLTGLCRVDFVPDAKIVPGYQTRAVHVRFVRVRVPVQGGIDRPFHDAKRGVEARGKAISNGAFEVISEDEVVARHGLFRDEGEADRILIALVEVVGEVSAGHGGAVGQA